MLFLVMRHAVAILLVLSFAACGTTRTSGRIIGGSMVALGGLSYVIADTRSETTSINDGIRQELDKTGGLLFMVAGAVILAFNEIRPLETEHAPSPVAVEARVIPDAGNVPAPSTSDPKLHQLTLQASFAARAGQCSAVRVIAERVGELDGDYRKTRFAADAAIAQCL